MKLPASKAERKEDEEEEEKFFDILAAAGAVKRGLADQDLNLFRRSYVYIHARGFVLAFSIARDTSRR